MRLPARFSSLAEHVWAQGLFAAAVYVALTFLFLPAARTSGQTFFEGVLLRAAAPEKHGMSLLLHAWRVPSWLRSQFGGEPFTANIQHGLWYPLNLPFWLFRTSTAIKVNVVIHVAGAAIAMWAYLRIGLKRSGWAAFAGGLVYGFGSETLMHTILPNQQQSIAWVPLVLLFTHLALEDGRLRFMVLGGVALGLEFLAGHPEWWVYTVALVVLYGVAWTFGAGLRGVLRRVLPAILRVGGVGVFFLVLFSWQLLPTLLLKSQGYRSSPGFNQQFPLPRAVAVNTLLPDYGTTLVGENVAFVGVVGLGLACMFIGSGERRERWLRGWLLVIICLGLLMAVGHASPLYRVVYSHVALVRSFRVPSRWLLFTFFGLALGTGLGVESFLARESIRERTRRGLRAAAAAAVIVAVAFSVGRFTKIGASAHWWLLTGCGALVLYGICSLRRAPRAVLALALIVVAGVELHNARPAAEYHQVAPDVVYDDPGPVLTLLGHGGRYVSIVQPPTSAELSTLAPLIPPSLTGQAAQFFLAAWPDHLAATPALQYSTLAETILGRDSGLMPLRTYDDFYAAVLDPSNCRCGYPPAKRPSQWNWSALDFMAVDWFVAPSSLPPNEKLILRDHGFTVALHVAYVDVWRRPTQPLARFVSGVDLIPGAGERVARLKDGYPLTSRAIVEEQVGAVRPDASDRVTTLRVAATTVTFEAHAVAPNLLVLADPSYPQWRVEIDGKPAKLLRVDHAFRGVVVPAGDHHVVFVYRDHLTQAGVALAIVAMLALIAFGLVRRRVSPRAR